MKKEQLELEKKMYQLRCQLVELTEIYNLGDNSQSLTDSRWQILDDIQQLEEQRVDLANQAWPKYRKQEFLKDLTREK